MPSEGTVSPSSLVFTATDWNAPQVVTVSGVDDTAADGARPYRIVLDPPTGDANYATIDPTDVDIVNLDNDTPAIQIIPPKVPTTTEFGGTAAFGVFLMSRPTDTVTIPIFSNNPGEGTPSHSQLRFTVANWATPQWVTVTGADDMVADGDVPYRITVGPAMSASAGYQGKRGNDVLLVNLDNETPGLAVSPVQGSTTEGGIATTFTVALTTKPTYTVTVPIVSTRPTEGTPLVSSLTFTPANWNAPQTVTVRGIDDRVIDGDQVYRIAIGPSASGDATNPGDSNYKGKRAPDVVIKNLDDDGGAIRVTAAPDLKTSEAGGTATFTVVLASAPSANVAVPLASLDTSEGTVTSPGSGMLRLYHRQLERRANRHHHRRRRCRGGRQRPLHGSLPTGDEQRHPLLGAHRRRRQVDQRRQRQPRRHHQRRPQSHHHRSRRYRHLPHGAQHGPDGRGDVFPAQQQHRRRCGNAADGAFRHRRLERPADRHHHRSARHGGRRQPSLRRPHRSRGEQRSRLRGPHAGPASRHQLRRRHAAREASRKSTASRPATPRIAPAFGSPT